MTFSIFLISIFNGIIFAIYCYFVSMIILKRKPFDIKRILLAFIPFIFTYYCILCLFDFVYAFFFSGICAFLFIRIIFQESMFMSLFISLILHTFKMVSKILLLLIFSNYEIFLINTYKTLDWKALLINVLTLAISAIIIILLRKKLRGLVNYAIDSKRRNIILLIAAYINFSLITIFQPHDNLFSLNVLTDYAMLYTITAIGVFSITSERKMEGLVTHYNEIFEYSKANGELVMLYKMRVHENKNKLLMIRSLLDGPKKEVKLYVESLIKEKNQEEVVINHWVPDLKYIPFPGIRNFINYKLIKLKELGAEIEVFISSDLEQINVSTFSDSDYNQLSTILGVIMDNMIDSIEIAPKKLISINLYVEDNKVHGEFVNTYAGEIDINRLYEVGYSTKGEQRGVGLPLVAKITKNNKLFTCTPEIIDEFFIQHITIKMQKSYNLQKNEKK